MVQLRLWPSHFKELSDPKFPTTVLIELARESLANTGPTPCPRYVAAIPPRLFLEKGRSPCSIEVTIEQFVDFAGGAWFLNFVQRSRNVARRRSRICAFVAARRDIHFNFGFPFIPVRMATSPIGEAIDSEEGG